MSFVSDALAISGSAVVASVVGAVISSVSQSAATRRADRNADRVQARALFSQITTAIAALDAQQADFRQRRDSPKANGLAVAVIAVEALAAHISGDSWIRALPSGLRWIRQWDADEGARFADRIQAIAAQINPALVSLSLLSPNLQNRVRPSPTPSPPHSLPAGVSTSRQPATT